MTINLLQTQEYKSMMSEHIFKTIQYLFEKNQEFAIACEIKHITFSPELPDSILESFDETVLFILSGYTFESATLEDTYFSFEAGFGSENFGSTVHVPLLAIKQLFLGDHPIILNLAEHSVENKGTDKIPKEKGQKNSMKSLLNNPENKKLLKKRK
jgi:hypothetical protein